VEVLSDRKLPARSCYVRMLSVVDTREIAVPARERSCWRADPRGSIQTKITAIDPERGGSKIGYPSQGASAPDQRPLLISSLERYQLT
jgi:hypothetical protein